MHRTVEPEAQALLNFTLDPAPTVRDDVEAIARVAGCRRPSLRLSYPLVLAGAALLEVLAWRAGRRARSTRHACTRCCGATRPARAGFDRPAIRSVIHWTAPSAIGKVSGWETGARHEALAAGVEPASDPMN